MARLILGIGGAIVGTAIGIGPSAGWIIGTTIGTLLFPPAGTTTEGPRLGDLSVTSSAYGAVIQKSFGTIRMGGNMIWSSGIEEVKSEDKVEVTKSEDSIEKSEESQKEVKKDVEKVVKTEDAPKEKKSKEKEIPSRKGEVIIAETPYKSDNEEKEINKVILQKMRDEAWKNIVFGNKK